MRIQNLILAGVMALSFSPNFSWALSESDFFCMAAPFHGFPPVFTKTVTGCSASGKPTVAYESTCSEETRCTFISAEIRKKQFIDPTDKTKIIHIDQFSDAQKVGYFQKNIYDADAKSLQGLSGLNQLKGGAPVVPGDGLDGHWLPTHMFCQVMADGKCPMPEHCKGDIQYDAIVSDYEHPDVDNEVNAARVGAGRIIQHQGPVGAGSAVGAPQEVPQ